MSRLKENLSNLFCADCFKSRAMSIHLLNKESSKDEWQLWKENNECLSRSEHARWVVEKLIMGYSPFSKQQRFEYENLFFDKAKKKQYLKKLKKDAMNPAHIDICSYRELRRINPDDLKFDSFLMLAIPKILDKESEDEKNDNYIPQPIDTSDVELPEELIVLAEQIAKNVHEVWSAGRIKEGWSWGEERNDVEKTHPCIIPYEKLPESEKEYDRNSAFETLRLIIKMGFKISYVPNQI